MLTAGNGLVAYRRLLRDDIRSMKRQVLSDHGSVMVGIARQYLLTPELSQQQIFLAQLCGLCQRREVNAYIAAAYQIVGEKLYHTRGSRTRSGSKTELTNPKTRLLLVNGYRFKTHHQLYVKHLCVTRNTAKPKAPPPPKSGLPPPHSAQGFSLTQPGCTLSCILYIIIYIRIFKHQVLSHDC